MASRDALSRYQPSDRNPGVGFDTKRKNFTLIVVENGIDKPFGSFLTEAEGVQGYGGMIDKKDRGPIGIEGLPRTQKRDGVSRKVLMELNGPPGVQLHPAGHWQQNNRDRDIRVNVGDFTTPQNRPMSASLLAGRPTAARRQRPSTALLHEKGQWSQERQEHLQEVKRGDVCSAENDRVEYNPDTMRKLWSGLWMPQRPPIGIPYDD